MANRKRINKEAAKKERCNTLREEGNKLYKSLDLDRGASRLLNPRSSLLKDSSGDLLPRCLED